MERVRDHWALGVVLAAFGGAALLIPTLAPVAISDDFLYARSVEILHQEHTVRVLPAAAMTLLFQIGWGGVFTSVFGTSFGVLRASTLVCAALGAVALHALCRELRVSTGRSALAAAVFLFNPVSLALSYTFMTDTYFLTLVTVALWLHVRGMRSGMPDVGWTIAGSVATACAFLVRQPGILVAVGVLSYLGLRGRLRWDRTTLRTVARIALVPIIGAVAYVAWARLAHGVPPDSGQQKTIEAIGHGGFGGNLRLVRQLVVLLATQLGMFVLPVALGAVVQVPGLVRRLRGRTALAAATAIAVPLLLAVGEFAPFATRLPWAPQFFGAWGVGPVDLHGGRPPVLSRSAIEVVLALAAIAAAVLVVAVAGQTTPPDDRTATDPPAFRPVLLLGVTGAWLALSVFPQSTPLRQNALSYDRYFLPLLPIVLAVFLHVVRPLRILTGLAVVLTAAMAAFSVAATHDHLTMQRAIWRVAEHEQAKGVPLTDLDAGAAWDGYHLYEDSVRHHVVVKLSDIAKLHLKGPIVLSVRDRGAWWIPFYAPQSSSKIVVSTDQLFGYVVIRTTTYDSWLHRDPQVLYLLRKVETG